MSLNAPAAQATFAASRMIVDALQIEGHVVHSWGGPQGQRIRAIVGGQSLTITLKCHRRSHQEREAMEVSP